MNSEELITLLGLEPHPTEGGYFRRTYQSARSIDSSDGSRFLLTSIYYLLTQAQPGGFLHRNQSDILHYHHLGAAIRYILVSPDGVLSERVLGPDIKNGETLQLLVPGGWWKASQICAGEYALISEAVAPGFDYADNEIATMTSVAQHFPELQHFLEQYIKK